MKDWGEDLSESVDVLLEDTEIELAQMHYGVAQQQLRQFLEYRQGWTFTLRQQERINELTAQLHP